ncbi:MAG: saccharopine dehydrogenase NADP-binding domain-containing protein [bacterium]
MRMIVLGGAGMVGSVVVRDLVRVPGVREVAVADFDFETAQKKAAELGLPASAKAADIHDRASLVGLLKGYDVAVNCVGPFYRNVPKVLEACLESRVHYVDMCDDYDASERLLGYHDRCRQANITAIISLGASPGFTNLCGLLGARKMEPQEIHTAWVESISDVGGGFATVWHGIHMAHGEVPQFLDGQWTKVPALSGAEELEFPAPLGRYPVYYLGHSEPVTLPRYIRGLKVATNKGNMWPSEIDLKTILKPFIDLGLGDTDTIRIEGREIVKRDFLVQYLIQAVLAQPAGQEPEEPQNAVSFMARVDVKGAANGKKVHHVYTAAMDTNEGTGGSAAYGAWSIASGKITARGCFAPEGCIDPEDYFRHMASKGIHLYETRAMTERYT